ncbi:MAG TPA: hypothetical protein VK081_12845 [Planctomycetota bacterium]|nr:hypothetical protein [Planctomycetota bacterium]
MGHALATIALAVGSSAALCAAAPQQPAGGPDNGAGGSPFAPPVRLQAGEKFMGEGRLYPSPVFHDVNGDGRLDVVIGDLMGRLTVALRLPGDGPPRFGEEQPLKNADGQPLKFHNW